MFRLAAIHIYKDNVKGGDNVFSTKGKLNEIDQYWCCPDLDFQLKPTGTMQLEATYIDLMQIHVA